MPSTSTACECRLLQLSQLTRQQAGRTDRLFVTKTALHVESTRVFSDVSKVVISLNCHTVLYSSPTVTSVGRVKKLTDVQIRYANSLTYINQQADPLTRVRYSFRREVIGQPRKSVYQVLISDYF